MHLALRTLLCACLAASTLAAGEHRGQVTFAGLPVPGATVTATQPTSPDSKKFVAVTDAKGAYDFPDIPDGTWKFHIEMQCFSPIERDVVIAPGAPDAIWELKLLPFAEIQAAAASQPQPKPSPAPTSAAPESPATTISAAPPPEQPAPTTPTASAKSKSKSKSKSAPQPTDTGAGYQRADLNASADSRGLSNDAAQPNQTAADGLLVNGSVNNGAASPFAQSAAFGNNRRGARSLYNGSIGITVDNAVLDAQTFSVTGQQEPRPIFNHMLGSASFGGPLYIPHLMKPSRTPIIFFVGYQWLRNHNDNTSSPGLMPTALQRAGDFSQTLSPLGLPISILDPTSGAPFPGNVIPQSRISPQAQSLLNLYPQPNFSGSSRYNYEIPLVGHNLSDAVMTNLQKVFSMKDTVSGNFGLQRTDSQTPNLFGFNDTGHTLGYQATVNYTRRFTTHVFSRFSYQFSRYSSQITPYFANRTNISAEAGIFGNNQDPQNWGPPSLSFSSGITGLSDVQESSFHNQTGALSQNTFWNHRSHNIQFGGDWKKLQFNSLSQQNARGQFTFTGAATGTPGVLGTGSDFADFLLGVPDTSSIAFGNADKYFRSSSYDTYFTDDWRISSGLTLNIGGRWEYSSPIDEKYGRLVNLDIAPGFTGVVPVVANDPIGALTGDHYPDSLLHPDKHEFQPRVGTAWRPFPASSLLIRSGYGVYYNTSVYQSIATQMAQQSPLSKSLSVQNNPLAPFTLANGFNASPATTANTFAVDPNFRVGYSQNWNVIVQRDLPFSLVMTATYIGIKGTREQQEFLPNTYPVGAVNPCPLCPAGYAYLTSNGDSTREAGQLQLRRRLHNGFTASLNYTWAKAIDDASLGGAPGTGGNTKAPSAAVIAQNWLDLSGERGRSTFDQRNLLTLTSQYTTGMGKAGGTLLSGWKGALYKEWTVSTSITAGSGLPENPIYVTAVNGTGVSNTIRPEYTGAPLYSAPSGFSLNPAAYIAPLPGQWGNAARDSITGPSQFSLNASLNRTFRLNDRFNADFRIDTTNLLNHVNYTSWITTVNSAQFGLPSAANAMRDVQASLRVRF